MDIEPKYSSILLKATTEKVTLGEIYNVISLYICSGYSFVPDKLEKLLIGNEFIKCKTLNEFVNEVDSFAIKGHHEIFGIINANLFREEVEYSKIVKKVLSQFPIQIKEAIYLNKYIKSLIKKSIIKMVEQNSDSFNLKIVMQKGDIENIYEKEYNDELFVNFVRTLKNWLIFQKFFEFKIQEYKDYYSNLYIDIAFDSIY